MINNYIKNDFQRLEHTVPRKLNWTLRRNTVSELGLLLRNLVILRVINILLNILLIYIIILNTIVPLFHINYCMHLFLSCSTGYLQSGESKFR